MWLKRWSGEGEMFWYNASCPDTNTLSKVMFSGPKQQKTKKRSRKTSEKSGYKCCTSL